MAAVLQQSYASTEAGSCAPRQSNEFIDRRALVDVSGVMGSIHPQSSDEEIWMMSYMDIITLLLTLFVLLLAFSKVTPETIEVAPTVQAKKHAVEVKAIAVQSTAPVVKAAAVTQEIPPTRVDATVIAVAKTAPPAVNAVEKTIDATAVAAPLLPLALDVGVYADAIVPPLRAVQQIVVPLRQETPATEPPLPVAVAAREKLLQSVRGSALGERIELSADQDNVNLAINDNILFDLGSATLKQNGLQLLDDLARLLTGQDYTVSVEGHSDNAAFSNAQFASNWELSATRATNVTRYLIDHGIAATRLRAIGYADTRPRADNDTTQGRARNRRVALVLHMPVSAASSGQAGDKYNGK